MSLPVINPLSLDGKCILITGASSGIGKASAILFAKLGANLILTGRNSSRLQEVFDLLHGNGHAKVLGDISCQNGRSAVVNACGKLDGVVHCAGIASRVVCKSIEDDDLSTMYDTNVFGPILLQKELLSAKCIKNGASIVFVSSISYRYPWIGNAIYSSTKGAIISYAKVLALELAKRKIRVNTISPAMIATDLLTSMGLGGEERRNDEKNYLLGTYGEPLDVANIAALLCSDASKWMTGGNIEITGGLIC